MAEECFWLRRRGLSMRRRPMFAFSSCASEEFREGKQRFRLTHTPRFAGRKYDNGNHAHAAPGTERTLQKAARITTASIASAVFQRGNFIEAHGFVRRAGHGVAAH